MDQRFDELKRLIQATDTELKGKIQASNASLTGKLDTEYAELNGKIGDVEATDVELEGKINSSYAELKQKIHEGDADLEKKMKLSISNFDQIIEGKYTVNDLLSAATLNIYFKLRCGVYFIAVECYENRNLRQ